MEKLSIKELAILKAFLDHVVSFSKVGDVCITVPRYILPKDDFTVLVEVGKIVNRAFWDKNV